eukprot:c28376_g1_i2 orf=564-2882(-)
MSGGFFRGTSAEQDTRFSNKMEKLLKTQKFAPELDQLVDMSKVKIDVIRPWIAKRVTELLGFEDEVLINFIYGLLEGKVVDGKHIQIQLTGFMEKNTGKFMRELWSLLTSAQNNISGVPQQLLDAKAEEARKKKAEDQRIVSEIMRKKNEEKETQQERERKIVSESEAVKAAGKPNPNRSPRIDAQDQSVRNADTHTTRISAKNGVSRHLDGNERSPYGQLHGKDSRRAGVWPSHSRSSSRSSFSSRSLSRSPVAHRRYRTGSIPQSPHRFRRSKSPARRGRSPRRRHSPVYSHSPSRRRPSVPWGHPRFRRRSPAYARSPRRRPAPSLSPRHYRSPSSSDSSPATRNFRSPVKILYHSHRRSLSRERGARYNGSEPRRERDRDHFSNPRARVNSRVDSPEIRSFPEQQQFEKIVREKQEQAIVEQDKCIPGDQPAVDAVKHPHSPTSTFMPSDGRRGSGYEEASPRNLSDTRRSPLREECPQQVDFYPRIKQDTPAHDSEILDQRDDRNQRNDDYVPHISGLLEQAQNKRVMEPVSVKELQVTKEPQNAGDKMCSNYGSEKGLHESLKKRQRSPTLESTSSEEKRLNVPKRIELNAYTVVGAEFRKLGGQREELVLPAVKSDLDGGDYVVGHCGGIRTQRPRTEERDLSSAGEDEDGSGSPPSEERRKSKKRRKEEKRLRKEERRRKREERHRRKEEKRAARAAVKAVASVTPPPDFGRDVGRLVGLSDYDSGGEEHRSEEDDMESEQKRLENELRKKALDSLRAKKAIQS